MNTSSRVSRRDFLCSIGITSLTFAVASSARASATVPDRSEWLARDKRLAQTVSVVRQRVFVGELFEEAAGLTGVEMTVNRLDGADSVRVTICARKIALVDLMAGIWSLMSYRNAAWRWETDGGGETKSPISYRLIRPVNAQNFAADLLKEIKQNGVDTMELAISALEDPTLIEKHAADHPGLTLSKEPLMQSRDKAFRSLFNKEERLRIVQGDMNRKIPRDEWTPEVHAYIKKREQWSADLMKKYTEDLIKSGKPLPDIPPTPPPQFVSFERSETAFPPVVYFGIDGIGGGAIVGSTTADKYWEEQYQARWLMPGDTGDDAKIGARTMPVPKEPPPPFDPGVNEPNPNFPPGTVILGAKPRRRNEDFRLLKEFNELTGVPVLARFVDDSTLFAHYDKPISEFVKELRKDKSRTVKWRDGMLLLTTILRDLKPTSVDLMIPMAVIRRFRQSVSDRPEVAPTLDDLCVLANALTTEQFDKLALTRILTPDPATVAGGFSSGLHPFWVYLDRNRDMREAITREGGILLRDVAPDAREAIVKEVAQSPGTLAARLLNSPDDVSRRQIASTLRLRLRIIDELDEIDKRFLPPLTATQVPPRRVRLEVFDRDRATDAASLQAFDWTVRDPVTARASLKGGDR